MAERRIIPPQEKKLAYSERVGSIELPPLPNLSEKDVRDGTLAMMADLDMLVGEHMTYHPEGKDRLERDLSLVWNYLLGRVNGELFGTGSFTWDEQLPPGVFPAIMRLAREFPDFANALREDPQIRDQDVVNGNYNMLYLAYRRVVERLALGWGLTEQEKERFKMLEQLSIKELHEKGPDTGKPHALEEEKVTPENISRGAGLLIEVIDAEFEYMPPEIQKHAQIVIEYLGLIADQEADRRDMSDEQKQFVAAANNSRKLDLGALPRGLVDSINVLQFAHPVLAINIFGHQLESQKAGLVTDKHGRAYKEEQEENYLAYNPINVAIYRSETRMETMDASVGEWIAHGELTALPDNADRAAWTRALVSSSLRGSLQKKEGGFLARMRTMVSRMNPMRILDAIREYREERAEEQLEMLVEGMVRDIEFGSIHDLAKVKERILEAEAEGRLLFNEWMADELAYRMRKLDTRELWGVAITDGQTGYTVQQAQAGHLFAQWIIEHGLPPALRKKIDEGFADYIEGEERLTEKLLKRSNEWKFNRETGRRGEAARAHVLTGIRRAGGKVSPRKEILVGHPYNGDMPDELVVLRHAGHELSLWVDLAIEAYEYGEDVDIRGYEKLMREILDPETIKEVTSYQEGVKVGLPERPRDPAHADTYARREWIRTCKSKLHVLPELVTGLTRLYRARVKAGKSIDYALLLRMTDVEKFVSILPIDESDLASRKQEIAEKLRPQYGLDTEKKEAIMHKATVLAKNDAADRLEDDIMPIARKIFAQSPESEVSVRYNPDSAHYDIEVQFSDPAIENIQVPFLRDQLFCEALVARFRDESKKMVSLSPDKKEKWFSSDSRPNFVEASEGLRSLIDVPDDRYDILLQNYNSMRLRRLEEIMVTTAGIEQEWKQNFLNQDVSQQYETDLEHIYARRPDLVVDTMMRYAHRDFGSEGFSREPLIDERPAEGSFELESVQRVRTKEFLENFLKMACPQLHLDNLYARLTPTRDGVTVKFDDQEMPIDRSVIHVALSLASSGVSTSYLDLLTRMYNEFDDFDPGHFDDVADVIHDRHGRAVPEIRLAYGDLLIARVEATGRNAEKNKSEITDFDDILEYSMDIDRSSIPSYYRERCKKLREYQVALEDAMPLVEVAGLNEESAEESRKTYEALVEMHGKISAAAIRSGIMEHPIRDKEGVEVEGSTSDLRDAISSFVEKISDLCRVLDLDEETNEQIVRKQTEGRGATRAELIALYDIQAALIEKGYHIDAHWDVWETELIGEHAPLAVEIMGYLAQIQYWASMKRVEEVKRIFAKIQT